MDKRFIWTIKEIEILKELYNNNTNVEIAKVLNKTKNSIDAIGYRLDLKKSKELLSRISKEANLMRINKGGRNLTYEVLKEIASKYKTRIEFQRNDGPAYNSARIKGFLDEICSHMTVIRFSTPQLILKNIMNTLLGCKGTYNNRKIIKPYEIDLYYTEFNLAFEYQGIAWHNKPNEINKDLIKKKLFKEKNINIIYVYEKTLKYEKDIKNQLIKNIIKINKITNKNITKNDILNCVVDNVYNEVYNKEELIQIAKKYDSFKKFKQKDRKVWLKLYKLKLIKEVCLHMKDYIGKIAISDNELNNIIKKYDNITDFRKNDLQIYKHIKRVKKDYLIKHLKTKKQTYPEFPLEKIKTTINNYKEKCDFIVDNIKMYSYLRKNGLGYLLKPLKRCTKQVSYNY